MRQAFSLVELSIVLVILGLLVGGVLSGQSLIHAAELRSIPTDINKYRASVGSFRDKYFAIPGDMANATSFWGKDNAACSGNTGTAATPGTCNGNGDGTLGTTGANSATAEQFQFWKQLALGGLIEGTYTGLSGPNGGEFGNGQDSVPGSNIPKARMGNIGFTALTLATVPPPSTYYWAGTYGNVFEIGTAQTGFYSFGAAFKPEDAWNLDTKMDDGNPASGKVRTMGKNYGANCVTTTDPTTTAYNLSYANAACAFIVNVGY